MPTKVFLRANKSVASGSGAWRPGTPRPGPESRRLFTTTIRMDLHTSLAVILVLCLVLVLVVYITGVEVGKASALRTHPGYEPTRASL
jgi:hypothetical protein